MIATTKALFFTTSDASGPRKTSLVQLVRRLAEESDERAANVHYVLLQGAKAEAATAPLASCNPNLRIMRTPETVSLSKARNLMMRRALDDSEFGDACIVGFPDDDALFPVGFIPNLLRIFQEDPELDVLVCRSSCRPDPFDTSSARDATAPELIRLSTSNTMFLRAELAKKIGYFDESLGLGTPMRGGEDTEYIMRAVLHARKVVYVDAALVEHAEPNSESALKYYPGALVAISWHAVYDPRFTLELARKLMVGVVHVGRGRMAITDLARSYAVAARTVLRSFGGGRGRRLSEELRF